jgi:hypothetical protein
MFLQVLLDKLVENAYYGWSKIGGGAGTPGVTVAPSKMDMENYAGSDYESEEDDEYPEMVFQNQGGITNYLADHGQSTNFFGNQRRDSSMEEIG